MSVLLLSGMSTMEQVVENVRIAGEAAARSLSEGEWRSSRRCAWYTSRDRCAVHRKRSASLPSRIDIPMVLAFLNDASLTRIPRGRRRTITSTWIWRDASVLECTKCGQWWKLSQHIQVPDFMEECARLFEAKGAA
jgi:predicted aldo/keto reductase-like oxidoreductase